LFAFDPILTQTINVDELDEYVQIDILKKLKIAYKFQRQKFIVTFTEARNRIVSTPSPIFHNPLI
jgi:hypothetical protein